MKRKWNSISVSIDDDDSRKIKNILMKTQVGSLMGFELYELNNKNLVVYVIGYDFSFAYEYDNWNEAFVQYLDWVRKEEQAVLGFARSNIHLKIDAVEGDIAIVTTKSGKQYVGVWTLAPGIDYFWDPVVPGTGTGRNQLTDPWTSFTVIGKNAQ